MQETVVFTGHRTISGQGAKGPWSKALFTDQAGREFGVWTNNVEGAALASQLLGLLNQPVTAEYEVSQRGKHTNLDLQGITPAPGNGTAAPAVVVAQPLPAVSGTEADKELRINRWAALERALMAFGIAGEDPLLKMDELLELSDQFVVYATQGREAVAVVEQPVAEPVA